MGISDLLLHLRERLLAARAARDDAALRDSWKVINAVLDAAYRCQDREVAAMLENMGDAARDSLMDVEWKSTIPAAEAIRKLER